jgi:hypothetical protein
LQLGKFDLRGMKSPRNFAHFTIRGFGLNACGGKIGLKLGSLAESMPYQRRLRKEIISTVGNSSATASKVCGFT